jgi:2-keto-3-deoxy-L-rhamnonate aldolase RhmA
MSPRSIDPSTTAVIDRVTAAARLRAKLRSGEPVVGAMIGFASPEVIEMIGLAGYDFVTVDIEHEPIGDADIMSMIRAADALDLPVVVRSPINHRVGTLLNFGAAGLQVPDVEGPGHLREIIDSVRFPPRGRRPGTLLSRIAGYGGQARQPSATDDPVVIAMIEDVAVVAELDEFLACDGVDAFYVGPYDLRASMGGPSDEDLQRVIGDIVNRCVSASAVVAVGVISTTSIDGAVVAGVSDVSARHAQGIRLFVVAVSMFLAQQLAAQRRELDAALSDVTKAERKQP